MTSKVYYKINLDTKITDKLTLKFLINLVPVNSNDTGQKYHGISIVQLNSKNQPKLVD